MEANRDAHPCEGIRDQKKSNIFQMYLSLPQQRDGENSCKEGTNHYDQDHCLVQGFNIHCNLHESDAGCPRVRPWEKCAAHRAPIYCWFITYFLLRVRRLQREEKMPHITREALVSLLLVSVVLAYSDSSKESPTLPLTVSTKRYNKR